MSVRTSKLNWWKYGVKIWLFTTFIDIERIPYQIEIPDENSLKEVVEGRKSNRYVCGRKGHRNNAVSPVQTFSEKEGCGKGRSS